MALAWYINGINLKDYGITVSGSLGLVDGLKRKEPFKVDLPDYHGEIVDLEKTIYESRDITLNCWIKASGMLDFTTKVNTFNLALKGKGTNRFMVAIDKDKPLVYEVYFPDKTAIDKKWDDSTMVGTFSLKMRESEPVKRVLKFKGLEFENRNLLRNSSFEKNIGGSGIVNGSSVTRVTGGYDGDYCMKTVSSNSVSSGYSWNNMPTIAGKEYIVSCYVKSDAPISGCNFGVYTSSWDHVRSKGVNIGTEWTRIDINFVATGTLLKMCILKANVTFYVDCVQLEEGNVMSEWFPAPEDESKNISLTISTEKLVNIHWGDGEHDFDIVGTNIIVPHTYKSNEDRFIIISGVIEEIKSITSNDLTTVWNIL